MSVAATMAGIPLNVAGTVLGHSISHTLGPIYKILHGIVSGMVTLHIRLLLTGNV